MLTEHWRKYWRNGLVLLLKQAPTKWWNKAINVLHGSYSCSIRRSLYHFCALPVKNGSVCFIRSTLSQPFCLQAYSKKVIHASKFPQRSKSSGFSLIGWLSFRLRADEVWIIPFCWQICFCWAWVAWRVTNRFVWEVGFDAAGFSSFNVTRWLKRETWRFIFTDFFSKSSSRDIDAMLRTVQTSSPVITSTGR